MWALLYPLLGGLLSWLIPKLLAIGGVVAVSETVTKPTLEWIESKLIAQLDGMGAAGSNFMSMMGVYDAVSIVMTAYFTALGLKAAKAAFAKSSARAK